MSGPVPGASRDPKRWVADLLTLSNGVFGFLSIATWAVELGPLSGVNDAYVAAAYIGLGMIADGLDGIVARKWGSTGLGNALDSMSDFTSFCVAPAVFLLEAHAHARGTALGAATAVVAVGFLVAGMVRLARQQDADGGDHFTGLPTPWSGATLALLLLLDVAAWPVLGATVTLGALNLSRLAYPKTRGAYTRIAGALLTAAVLVIGTLFLFPGQAGPILWSAAALAAFMIVVGPVLAARGQAR